MFCRKPETSNPVSLKISYEELRTRVDSLTDDEAQVYKWLREYYSERWIAETMFISRAQLRALSKSLCRKLGVSDICSIRRLYNSLDIQKKRETVNTGEIDGYVEARTEKEIQTILKEKP